MTMSDLLLACAVAFLIFMWSWERFQWRNKESAWAAERRDLLNRLMVKDWPTYMALSEVLPQTEPLTAKDAEDLKTTEYDKAWAS